jgi:hypothetical protein
VNSHNDIEPLGSDEFCPFIGSAEEGVHIAMDVMGHLNMPGAGPSMQ